MFSSKSPSSDCEDNSENWIKKHFKISTESPSKKNPLVIDLCDSEEESDQSFKDTNFNPRKKIKLEQYEGGKKDLSDPGENGHVVKDDPENERVHSIQSVNESSTVSKIDIKTIGLTAKNGLQAQTSNSLTPPKDDNFVDVHSYLQIVLDVGKESQFDQNVEEAINNPERDWEKDYKLRHFREMIDSVLNDDNYKHLFDDKDWQIIYKFSGLPHATQALYLRLLVRKSGWIRLSSIKYPDIDHLKSRLQDLVQANFIQSIDQLTDLTSALNVLDAGEVKKFAKNLRGIIVKGRTTKEILIEAIQKHVKSSQSISSHFFRRNQLENSIESQVLKQLKKTIGNTCFKVTKDISCVFTRVSVIRFPPVVNEDEDNLILGQEFFNLWKIEKGELKYVPYQLNRLTKVFPTREHLIKFEEASRLEHNLIDSLKNCTKVFDKIYPKLLAAFDSHFQSSIVQFDRSLPRFLRQFSAGHIIVRALTTLINVFEREKNYFEAIVILDKLLSQDVYCAHYRGRWYERKALNLERHLKAQELAKEVILESLRDNYVRAGHRYSLYLRATKQGLITENLLKDIPTLKEFELESWTSVVLKQPVFKGTIEGRKNMFISNKDDGQVQFLTVEQAALEYYVEQGYSRGIHCEGIVFNSLFCLLFWDIIYNDEVITSDAFHSPYQRVPLDLNYDEFYSRRYPLIQERLQLIKYLSKQDIIQRITSVWDTYYDHVSLVNWEKCSIQILTEIISCLSNHTLAAIFERLSKDYKSHRSGFPDLLLWNLESGKIIAIEVKGPGDTLMPKQALWLDYLRKNGLESGICYVQAKR